MMRIGCRDQIDGTAIGKVHEDLVSLRRRNHQVSDLDRLRKIAGVAGDNEERPPVGEAQIEVAGVGGIQQAQPHQAGRDTGDGTNDAVDEQRVALEPVHDVHHVWLVDELAIAAEALVLQHDRQIVDAVGRGQAAVAVGAVADDHHAGKTRIDLPGRVAVRVRMEPRRRRGLLDRDLRATTLRPA